MASNPKPRRRALRAVPTATDESGHHSDEHAIAAAIDRNTAAVAANTEAIELLRVALCGSSRDPRPNGSLGEIANLLHTAALRERGL